MSDQAPVSLRDRLNTAPRVSTMTRLHDAMHRLERLAEAMEKAADQGEQQLEKIKGRL